MKNKIAIITTHPIQYNAPWFKKLNDIDHIELMVFYTWSQTRKGIWDKKFEQLIKWDIPLLEGYTYQFVENRSSDPGTHHYKGIDCPTLIDQVKSFKPHIIIVIGWKFKSHFALMRYFKGKVRIWFRGDSTLIDSVSGYREFLRFLILRYVYKHIDSALYVGKANKQYFLKYGLREQQLILAPHSVENQRFNEPDAKYNRESRLWKHKIGFSNSLITVLFVGKFEHKKQPQFLIDAVQKVNSYQTKLQLLLVGNGELETSLKVSVGDDEYIKFLPFQNQSVMPIIYRMGDILCLPSIGPGETWGLAVNEAMASGRPAIVSDKVGSAMDLVIPEKTGYIFNSTKIHTLITILNSLNLPTLKGMGHDSKKFIQQWSHENLVNNIHQEVKYNSKIINL